MLVCPLLVCAPARVPEPLKVDRGTIVSVDASKIELQNSARPPERSVYLAGPGLKVWRGQTFFELTALRPGDVALVGYRAGPNGQRILRDVWADAALVVGVISRTGAGTFEVNQAGQPPPVLGKGSVSVSFNGDTTFVGGSAGDLIVGRRVRIVGSKKPEPRKLVADWIEVFTRPPPQPVTPRKGRRK